MSVTILNDKVLYIHGKKLKKDRNVTYTAMGGKMLLTAPSTLQWSVERVTWRVRNNIRIWLVWQRLNKALLDGIHVVLIHRKKHSFLVCCAWKHFISQANRHHTHYVSRVDTILQCSLNESTPCCVTDVTRTSRLVKVFKQFNAFSTSSSQQL